ncbi:hypothetical protein ANCDUO_20244, partial [Ancylostoma duodenale]
QQHCFPSWLLLASRKMRKSVQKRAQRNAFRNYKKKCSERKCASHHLSRSSRKNTSLSHHFKNRSLSWNHNH